MRYKDRLPPLAQLIAFEASARLGSFTKAAVELNVTQPAISRQIRDLERSLGVSLFRRLHRSVEPSPEGVRLAETMLEALTAIDATLVEISEDDSQREIVVSSLVAFSTLWLVPRLNAFRKRFPDIRVRVITEDDFFDLRRSNVDLAIRYGDGNWTDGRSFFLTSDEIFPVCSKDFYEEHGPIENLFDVLKHPIIGYTSKAGWLDWSDLFAHAGIEAPQIKYATSYGYYTDGVMATLAGQGILLGWGELVAPFIRSGELMRIGKDAMPLPMNHYVVASTASDANAKLRTLIGFLCQKLDNGVGV